jgi:hypothetical protein
MHPRVLARVVKLIAPALALAALLGAPRWARAQQPPARQDTAGTDSTQMYILRTRDGSLFIGRLTRATVDTVYFVSAGGPIALPRSVVVELRQLGHGAMRRGVYWPPNPAETRLFFAPTGRMLDKGEGYFSDTYLFFLNFVGGLTRRVTLGGGFSVFPTGDFTDNILYLTPKVGLVQTPRFNLAAGALLGFAGFGSIDLGGGNSNSFGILYSVATAGSSDASVTFGAGVAYAGSDFANRPLLMLGGEKRVARRVSLVTENYALPGDNGSLVSYGVRFFGDRLSTDLAFWNLFGVEDPDPVFPGIPYVAFAVKF